MSKNPVLLKIQSRLVVSIVLLLALPRAWAGQGWYLLQPLPRGSSAGRLQYEPDLTAPLRSWTQYRSYDTAKECEAEKKTNTNSQREVLSKHQAELKQVTNPEDPYWKEQTVLMSFGIWNTWRNSLCIASDDPRLK